MYPWSPIAYRRQLGEPPILDRPSRNEPVQREEVRLGRCWQRDQVVHQVLTMPLGTYEHEIRTVHGQHSPSVSWVEHWLIGIPGLWEPLWEEIAAKLAADHAKWNTPELRAIVGAPRVHILAPRPELKGSRIAGSFPPHTAVREYVCEHCARPYLGVELRGNQRVAVCSDHCEHERSKAVERRWRHDAGISNSNNALRANRRAEARSGRVCEHCGQSFEAARSTRRFCSDICRVRWHRTNPQAAQ